MKEVQNAFAESGHLPVSFPFFSGARVSFGDRTAELVLPSSLYTETQEEAPGNEAAAGDAHRDQEDGASVHWITLTRKINRTAEGTEILLELHNAGGASVRVEEMNSAVVEKAWQDGLQVYIQGRHKNDIPSIVTPGLRDGS